MFNGCLQYYQLPLGPVYIHPCNSLAVAVRHVDSDRQVSIYDYFYGHFYGHGYSNENDCSYVVEDFNLSNGQVHRA